MITRAAIHGMYIEWRVLDDVSDDKQYAVYRSSLGLSSQWEGFVRVAILNALTCC